MKKLVIFVSALMLFAPMTSFAIEISQSETDSAAKKCGEFGKAMLNLEESFNKANPKITTGVQSDEA